MNSDELLGTIADAGARRVLCVISTSAPDRSGDIVVASGCDATAFLRTRSVLWNHDQSQPIARCIALEIGANRITATAEFPPEGKVANSDRIYGMVKAGLVNAVSIGFLPREQEPIDPKNPRKGARFTRWELLEFSFVAVPANAEALITHRAARHGAVAMTREQRLRHVNMIELGLDPVGPSAQEARLRHVAEVDARGRELAVRHLPDTRAERLARLRALGI